MASAGRRRSANTVQRRAATGDRDDDWQRITSEAIIDSTNFLDNAPEDRKYRYRITAPGGSVSETVEVDASAEATMLALDIPLNPDDAPPKTGIALGELCNDGRIGYVLRVIRGKTIRMLAYGHDGRALWEIDTKLSPVGGWDGSTLHAPMLCWDVNGDGRTEVIFRRDKTATGKLEYEGTGPDETMVAVDAETGQVVWERPWPGGATRENITVGHLRGMDQPASVVLLDGTYGDEVLTAIAGESGEISWRVEQARPAGHNLDIGDIDGDGVQEVICGGICYNGDGTIRWEAEPFGHTDISKPARIDPNRDGLQIWYAVESGNPGVYFVDNKGRTIFKEQYHHAHYGWLARHTAEIPGLQPHTAEDARRSGQWGTEEKHREMATLGHFPIFLPDGSHWGNLTDWQRKNFVPVHWDAGSQVVFIIRNENKHIVRLRDDGQIEDLPEAKLPEVGEYGRNLACADVIGDFRENIVTYDAKEHRLMVLVNPTVCNVRGYSPYDDFHYRHDRSQHGSGYYIYLSAPDTVVNRLGYNRFFIKR